MIAEARKRIAEKPTEYFKGIYGINEVGGTNVFILSAVPFEQLALRTDLPKHALPPLTASVLTSVCRLNFSMMRSLAVIQPARRPGARILEVESRRTTRPL